MNREAIVALADAYHAAPTTTTEAQGAYSVLGWYVLDRAHEAIRAGWSFERELYGLPPDLDAVLASKVLPVYDGAHEHPEFSDVQNFLFRFVHDVFGHFGISGGAPLGFGFENEVAACRRQQADLRHWARAQRLEPVEIANASRAIYGEIVGQAACFEIDGAFPRQKAVLL